MDQNNSVRIACFKRNNLYDVRETLACDMDASKCKEERE